MKKPEEIKKGLGSCSADECHGDHTDCPYIDNVLCIRAICGDALAYIRQLEARVPRWIPVEERMPEGEGWVLVIGLLLKKKKGNYGWCVPHVAEYRHGRWCDADGMLPDLEERSLKVTHWMPLPEPPKEGKE